MQANFWTFSKRENSTSRPADEGDKFEIYLKDEANATAPTIELRVSEYPAYNYCYIYVFRRYYFVNEWTYYRGTWTAQCAVDVLASWKDNILGATCAVAYSNAGSYNMIDGRFPCTKSYDLDLSAARTDFFDRNTGTFVLGVINQIGSIANGALSTYALTPQQMQSFANWLSNQDTLANLKQFFENPYEAVIFCNWLPLSLSAFTGYGEEITIGWQIHTGIEAQRFTARTYSDTITLSIPWGSVTGAIRCKPFTTLSMYLPYVGVVSLENDLLFQEDSIAVSIAIDLTDGTIAYQLLQGEYNNNIIATFGGSSGASIPIARTQNNAMAYLTGIAEVVGGAVAGLASGQGVTLGMVAGGLSQTLQGAQIHTQVNGALSSRVASAFPTLLKIMRVSTIPDYGDRAGALGLPTGKVMSLSTLTGYVQTTGASVSAPATGTELSEINSMLDSGIFIE